MEEARSFAFISGLEKISGWAQTLGCMRMCMLPHWEQKGMLVSDLYSKLQGLLPSSLSQIPYKYDTNLLGSIDSQGIPPHFGATPHFPHLNGQLSDAMFHKEIMGRLTGHLSHGFVCMLTMIERIPHTER